MRPLLSPGQRDRSRLLLAFLSGTLAAATGAGVVAATAAVAHETAMDRAAKNAATAVADAEAARIHQAAMSQWAAQNPAVGSAVLAGASSPGNAKVGGAPAANGTSSTPPSPPPAPPARSSGS